MKNNINMEAWQISIISSVIGAAVGGLFSLLGVYLTFRHQDKQKREDELKEEYNQRPRLEFQWFKDLEHGVVRAKCDCECVLLYIKEVLKNNETLRFLYNDKALDQNNLCCVEYSFVNNGKTEIDSVCLVSTQPQTTAVVELGEREFLLKNNLLCYEAWSKKRNIKPGQSITIKVCYLKDEIIVSPIGATLTIYMQDINGNYWCQPLFCPLQETDNSTRVSFKEFNNDRNVSLAIECFKDPKRW